MLVRHYIHQRLKEYYAQSAASVVGGLNGEGEGPIAFRSLWGEWHWNNVYAKLYQAQQGQWLTPSELFQPYYSQCLAEWVASRIAATMSSSSSANAATAATSKKKIRLMELGGGRGTNALCLLDHLERHYPKLYDTVDEYVLADSSTSLLGLQQERTTRHIDKITHRLCDLQDVAEGRDSLFVGTSDDNNDDHHHHSTTTIVLALEVLDNLPHDRIIRRRRNGVDKWSQLDLVETAATTTSTGRGSNRYQEIERPLTDPLLQRCLSLTNTKTQTPLSGSSTSSSWLSTVAVDNNNSSAVCWYPTIAIGVLDHVLSQQHQPPPHHHVVEMLIADFDMLPDVVVDGGGHHPLITDMDKVDYHHYLQPPASPTDILFATDFELLARVCRNYPSSSSTRDDDDDDDRVITATVSKQGVFLKRYPHIVRHTRSRFGLFSPMIDSFSNCSILTVERTKRTTMAWPGRHEKKTKLVDHSCKVNSHASLDH